MSLKRISPEELHRKVQDKEHIIILDVRDKEKYNDYHLAGPNIESIHIFKKEILEDKEIKGLPIEKEIVVTCTTGNSAAKCAAILAEKNYDVVVLDGGLTAWKDQVETK